MESISLTYRLKESKSAASTSHSINHLSSCICMYLYNIVYLERLNYLLIIVGEFTCRVIDTTGLYATWSLSVDVVEQPKISISPVAKSINNGDSVDITCRVVSPLSYDVTFTWVVNGQGVTAANCEFFFKIYIQVILRLSI